MSLSENPNYSLFFLRLTYILISIGLILGLIIFGGQLIVAAAWGGKSIWIVVNILKIPLVLLCYSFISFVGAKSENKIGILSGLGFSLSLSLIGILGIILSSIAGLDILLEFLGIIVALLSIGVGMFLWTTYHFKQKFNPSRFDSLVLIALVLPVLVFFILDWYFLYD